MNLNTVLKTNIRNFNIYTKLCHYPSNMFIYNFSLKIRKIGGLKPFQDICEGVERLSVYYIKRVVNDLVKRFQEEPDGLFTSHPEFRPRRKIHNYSYVPNIKALPCTANDRHHARAKYRNYTFTTVVIRTPVKRYKCRTRNQSVTIIQQCHYNLPLTDAISARDVSI